VVDKVRSGLRQRGLTLLELMITLALSVILTVVISSAVGQEMREQIAIDTQRANVDQTSGMEQELTQTISGALLDPTVTAAAATTATTAAAPAPTPSTYFQSVNDGSQSSSGGDGRLTITTTVPVPLAAIGNLNDDWPTQQTTYGPVGGPVEISFGVNPVGSPPNGETGLFERIQHPGDGDPTQGGTERLLDTDVTSIGFQFWDGAEWDPSWDTTTMTTPTLPQAVQVTYRLKSDIGVTDHMFVIPVRASTVSVNNPVQVSQ
jgi:prepilin-type N-terminal cleavage/methylation domain-containing protein